MTLSAAAPLPVSEPQRRVLLVGNPNVGKSVVFGRLTGTYVTVSNYPGTTVEVTRGTARLEGDEVEVVDTPGTNNLTPVSEDERVTRDLLLEGSAAVLQVGDAKSLRRVLLLSAQLCELGLPFSLVLNMMDEARSRGIGIDVPALSRALGVAVVEAVAVLGVGLDEVRRASRTPSPPHWAPTLGAPIEEAVAAIEAQLPAGLPVRPRGLALMLLAGDRTLDPFLEGRMGPEALARLRALAAEQAARFPGGAAYAVNVARLGACDRLVAQVVRRPGRRGSAWLDRLGLWAMHPVWGWPILAAVLWGMYEFVGVFGAGTLVDLLESTVFGEWLNPLATRLVDTALPFAFAHDLLVGEYGVVTMALTYGIAIVLPIVGTFFVAFSVMEDSGYLPRLAVMVDRAFRAMGLNGKAVLPMVLGLGCDTMATLTTRILESRKERVIVTLLLALGVPCSAQLGVILGVLATLPAWAGLTWAGVVVGTMLAVGFLASRVLPGRRSDFMLEVPPLRRPQLSNILIKTAARIEWYLREALPLFVVGTLILFALDRLDLLVRVQEASAPAVQGLLSLPAQASEAFLVGFLRRDYGATMFFEMHRSGDLDTVQTVVSLVAITLFMPCIANFFMIVKEQGIRTALAMGAAVVLIAFGVGAALDLALRAMG